MKALLDIDTLLYRIVHSKNEQPSLSANMDHDIEVSENPLLDFWEYEEKTTYSTLGEVFNGDDGLYYWGFKKGELDNLELADTSFVLVETKETDLGKVSKIIKESTLEEKAREQETDILKYYLSSDWELPFELITVNGSKYSVEMTAQEALNLNKKAE